MTIKNTKLTRAIRQRRTDGPKEPRWVVEFYHPVRQRWEFLSIQERPHLVISDGTTWYYQDCNAGPKRLHWKIDPTPHNAEEIPAECNWTPPNKR